VDADGDFGKNDQEMFAPGSECEGFLSGKACYVQLCVTGHGQDLFASKRLDLLSQNYYGRAFGHIELYANGKPGLLVLIQAPLIVAPNLFSAMKRD
jgi:hypothetical protein